MTEQQFCYWLQGFAELSGDCPPTPEQWKSIREHLALCFKKVTPPVGKPADKIKSDFDEALERLRKDGGKVYPAPPRDSTGIQPNWMQNASKVTITC